MPILRGKLCIQDIYALMPETGKVVPNKIVFKVSRTNNKRALLINDKRT